MVTFPNTLDYDHNRGQFAVFRKYSDGSNAGITCWRSYTVAKSMVLSARRCGGYAALYVDGEFSPVLEG